MGVSVCVAPACTFRWLLPTDLKQTDWYKTDLSGQILTTCRHTFRSVFCRSVLPACRWSMCVETPGANSLDGAFFNFVVAAHALRCGLLSPTCLPRRTACAHARPCAWAWLSACSGGTAHYPYVFWAAATWELCWWPQPGLSDLTRLMCICFAVQRRQGLATACLAWLGCCAAECGNCLSVRLSMLL